MQISRFSSTTPFRYAIAFSILLIISNMLAMSVIYSHFHTVSESTAKERIKTKAKSLSSGTVSSLMLQNLPSDIIVFKVHKPLPTFLQERINDGYHTLLSAEEINTLGWSYNAFDGRLVAALVSLEDGYALIALPVLSIKTSGLLQITLYTSLTILLVMLSYGFLVSRRMLYNINLIDHTAKDIMTGDYKKRISLNPNKHDEYRNLIKTLNAMLEKNQQLMMGLRQVNQNIAHDLKTPLNRLRSRIEVGLIQSHKTVDYPAILAESIEDIDGLLATFNALLLLGNLEFQYQKYSLKPIRLDELLTNLVALYADIAEDKKQCFETKIADSINIAAHQHLLTQAISNLIDNAVKYTHEGGNISVSLTTRSNLAIISVADNGPGISPSEYDSVFDRFKRLDVSRHLPGNGLGLSLVKSILNIHHAQIRLMDNKPGLIVEIRIRML